MNLVNTVLLNEGEHIGCSLPAFFFQKFCIFTILVLFVEAPPPTYDAIFGKVKQIQKDSLEKVGSCGDKTYQIFVSVRKFTGV